MSEKEEKMSLFTLTQEQLIYINNICQNLTTQDKKAIIKSITKFGFGAYLYIKIMKKNNKKYVECKCSKCETIFSVELTEHNRVGRGCTGGCPECSKRIKDENKFFLIVLNFRN